MNERKKKRNHKIRKAAGILAAGICLACGCFSEKTALLFPVEAKGASLVIQGIPDVQDGERNEEKGEGMETDASSGEASGEVWKDRAFPDVLGSYFTCGGGTDQRINNITLAAQACDGVILKAGEEFSFNETVGERTAERGYQEATVYISGTISQDLGGGICQVSSTLFAAALYADLEITQRANHSLTVNYMPMGMDAAVSWGGPDFCFQNNTDYPIQLSVTYEDGNLDVEILGTRQNDRTTVITTEETDSLTAKTFRSYYDSRGILLDTEQVATSRYRGIGED